MKKLFVFAVALATLFSVSCDSDDELGSSNGVLFVGTVTVSGRGEGEDFVQTDKEFEVVENKNNTATLWMYRTKFDQNMPMELDMEVRGLVSHTNNASNTVILTGTDLIPFAGSDPFPPAKITDFNGVMIVDKSLELEFTCMGLTVKYSGNIKK